VLDARVRFPVNQSATFMNAFFSMATAVTSWIDPSPYLIKASDTGGGIMLEIGDMYVWSLLGITPLLVISALVLIRTMYVRVEFFALEFGRGGFWGRVKAIGHFIALGFFMIVVGLSSGFLGWHAADYSVTLSPSGLVEVSRDGTVKFGWDEVLKASDHIRSTEFGITFAKGSHRCRVLFRQSYIGEELQDKAIAITENAFSLSPLRRK